jgi:hypothetical protein
MGRGGSLTLLLAAAVALAGCGAVYATQGAGPGAGPGPSGPAAEPLRVTLADNGRTLAVQTGSALLLALGEDQQWTVEVADPSVLARVPNVLTVRGTQGLYRALRPGRTTLSATGRPPCAAGEVCAMYLIDFRITVQVQGG